MKLLKQMINKKLESHSDYSFKKFTIRSIWQFYQAVNICISFLKINGIETLSKKETKRRNNLYWEIFLKGKLNERESNQIDIFMNKEIKFINQTLELIENIKNETKESSVNFEKDEFVAILGSEIEEFL